MSTSDGFNVQLPADLGEYILGRVAKGEYASAAEYLSSLVEADRDLQIEVTPELERLLLEGLHSGPGRTISDEEWERKIQDLLARHAEPKAT